MPLGGLSYGPLRTAGSVDLSANSPGRDGFTPIIEKNLRPENENNDDSFVLRIPGPGEPGFKYSVEKKLLPGLEIG